MTGGDCSNPVYSCCWHREQETMTSLGTGKIIGRKAVMRCCWCGKSQVVHGKWMAAKDHGGHVDIGYVEWKVPE